MRSKGITGTILILIMVFTFSHISGQEEKTPVESVRVVNVEVPVRVFHKGSPVDQLTRQNFQIFENGKKQKINGFYIKRKILNKKDFSEGPDNSKGSMSSRYFVLVFKISEYNEKIHKGIEYLFSNILQRSDQCLVFINDRSIFFKDLNHKEHARSALNKILIEESKKARQNIHKYILKVEDEISEFDNMMTIVGTGSFGEPATMVLRFLKKYLWVWKEYNNIFLKPNLDSYYYFSRHLEKIRKEKWVINFYQMEKFPMIKSTGRVMELIKTILANNENHADAELSTMGKAIKQMLWQLDLEMHSTRNFPADEVSKLFIKIDATFHSILIPVSRQFVTENVELGEVSSEIESSLREITKKTGGSLQRTGNLKRALDNIQGKEEVTYMLTYSPDDPDKIGKIRVNVDNKKFKVLYDDQMRADYIHEYLKKKKLEIPDIRILNAEFKNKILSVNIKDFLMSKKEELPPQGKIFIEIEILDAENKILYDKKKTIVAEKEQVSISVDFPWLEKGKYNLIVQVTDIQTGKSSSDFLQPVIH